MSINYGSALASLVATQTDVISVNFHRHVRTHRKAANYFFIDLKDWKVEAQLRYMSTNLGYPKTRATVLETNKKMAPLLRRTLKKHLPKKKKPRKIRGSVASFSAYPPSHKNWWKYGRRGGELKKSVLVKSAKAQRPFYPYLMTKLPVFPWFFLRGGTVERETKQGRKTGSVPKRIYLGHWASSMSRTYESRLVGDLRKYSFLGNVWVKKPNPPSGLMIEV